MNKDVLIRLQFDADKRVSNWFLPHDSQTVTCNRGDLRELLSAYKGKTK